MTPPIQHITKAKALEPAKPKYKKRGRPVTTGQIKYPKSFGASHEQVAMLEELAAHFAVNEAPNNSAAVCISIEWVHNAIFGGGDKRGLIEAILGESIETSS